MEADVSDPRASVCPVPGAGGDNGHTTESSPSQAARRMLTYIGELREFLSYYAMAKTDSVKLSVRQALIYGGLGAAGLVVLVTAMATGVVLLLLGCAWGLGALLGTWAGLLIVGFAILALIGLGAYIALKSITRSSRTRTVQKYEKRQQWQRTRFGRTVAEQASDAKAE